MKQITIISGKGGTGKTVITASFAALAKNAVLVDCDVDAADLHLLLKPEIQETHEFRSGVTARIDKEACTECGACVEACRFNAIQEFIVDPVSCEGCAVCSHVCLVNAIRMEENLSGHWFISTTKYGPMIHARLGIAEENSGKLVSQVRKIAHKVAEEKRLDWLIVDGPPGIGCPVIASLSGVDLALIVTEPTLSGIHDMERVADVAAHFTIPTGVVINKYDINLENSDAIQELCDKRNINVLARLPFSEDVVKAVVQGIPVVEFSKDGIVRQIAELWNKVVAL
jgi:MinD superfamily P-loop ATPase